MLFDLVKKSDNRFWLSFKELLRIYILLLNTDELPPPFPSYVFFFLFV